MHDLFDIVGLSRSAPAVEVRRVCARLVRRAHPDFGSPADEAREAQSGRRLRTGLPPVQRDVAVEFMAMTSVFDRIESSFFRGPGPRDF